VTFNGAKVSTSMHIFLHPKCVSELFVRLNNDVWKSGEKV